MGLFLIWTVLSVRYALVWQNEETLWRWAVGHAPDKPRPHLQLAVALLERHQWLAAQAVLDDTPRTLAQPTVPAWDRAEGTQAMGQLRVLLSRMAGTGVDALARASR